MKEVFINIITVPTQEHDYSELPPVMIFIRKSAISLRSIGIHRNLTTLLEGITFGEKKGEYPVASRSALENQIASIAETLSKLKDGSKMLSNSDMDNIIIQANKAETTFKNSVRAEDFFPLPAELHINGKNGRYIDFGVHPEYTHFGNSGEQEFAVDFWVKLTDVDHVLSSFVFLVSTFTDKPLDGAHDRQGWNFDKTVADDSVIKDITGKYTAKPVGSFSWIRQ